MSYTQTNTTTKNTHNEQYNFSAELRLRYLKKNVICAVRRRPCAQIYEPLDRVLWCFAVEDYMRRLFYGYPLFAPSDTLSRFASACRDIWLWFSIVCLVIDIKSRIRAIRAHCEFA